MAFDQLSEKFQAIFANLKKKGRVSEADLKLATKEVKMALLEADVNFKVVKQFVNSVNERALGKDVMEGLNPGQQVIKIVHEEMIALMGATNSELNLKSGGITVMMMVGLQGAGKTTTTAKLAGVLKKKGKKPLLVACDVYRPAAIKQLHVVGEQQGVAVFSLEGEQDPITIAKAGHAHAVKQGFDVIIIDTAGRLHIDENMMGELVGIKTALEPDEVLLVVDAMTGQDAVNVAETFNTQINIDGVILTKLDGDTRGGAALSVKAVTNKPIKFVGMGEKLSDLEVFHPDRMASRILGMGDVLTLIEKAEANMDATKAAEMERKFRKAEFTYGDFLDQMQQIKSMGSIQDLLAMIPGASQMKNLEVDDKQIGRIESMILSMTPEERNNPDLMSPSRKKRIAAGSGTTMQDVNRFVKQFEQSKKMMKQMGGMMKGKKGKKMMGGMGGMNLPF